MKIKYELDGITLDIPLIDAKTKHIEYFLGYATKEEIKKMLIVSRNEIRKLSTEVDKTFDLEQVILSLEDEVADLENEIDELKDDLNDAEREIENLKDELIAEKERWKN